MHRAYWYPQTMGEKVKTDAITQIRKIFVLLLLAFFLLPELDVPVLGDAIKDTLTSTGIALPWGTALTLLFFLTFRHAREQLARLPAWLLATFIIVALYLSLQILVFAGAGTIEGVALRGAIATLSAPIIVVGTFVIASYLPWGIAPRAMLVIFVLSLGVFLNQILGLRLNNFIVENWTQVWFSAVLPAYVSLGFGLDPSKAYTPTIASEASHEVYTYLTLLTMGYVAMRRHAISRLAWLFTVAAFLFVAINNGSRSSLFIVVISGIIFYLLNILASYQQNILRTVFYILMPVVAALILIQIPLVEKLVFTTYQQWQFLQTWADIHYDGVIGVDSLEVLVGPRFYPLAVHIQTPLYYPIGLPINTSAYEMYQYSLEKLGMNPLETVNLLLQQYVGNRELMNETATEALVVDELETHNQIAHALHSHMSPRTWITYTWAYLGVLGWLISASLLAYSAFVAYILFQRNELVLAAVLLTVVIASSLSTGVGGTQLYFIFGLVCAIAHGRLYLPPRKVSEKFLSRGGVYARI